MFLQGFTNPGGSMSSRTEARLRGFLAGQEYRRANPTKTGDIMKGFGYTEVEADGVWTVLFEHSRFRPDKQPKQWWWLWLPGLGNTQSDLSRDAEIPGRGVRVRVRGYLSPTGRFGHLGGYDHEIFATSISRIGG
jgi:hypothetical protein